MMMLAPSDCIRSFRRRLRKGLTGFLLLRTRKIYAHCLPSGDSQKYLQRSQRAVIDHARKAMVTFDEARLESLPPSVTWKGTNAWQRLVIADSLTEYAGNGRPILISPIELPVGDGEALTGNDEALWADAALHGVYRIAPRRRLRDPSKPSLSGSRIPTGMAPAAPFGRITNFFRMLRHPSIWPWEIWRTPNGELVTGYDSVLPV